MLIETPKKKTELEQNMVLLPTASCPYVQSMLTTYNIYRTGKYNGRRDGDQLLVMDRRRGRRDGTMWQGKCRRVMVGFYFGDWVGVMIGEEK